MAIENAHITAVTIEASEYMDLVDRYRIDGVPKTIINETGEILGALPEQMFVEKVIESLKS